MRERIAGPRGAGKPLQLAGSRTGHTTVGGDNEKLGFTAREVGGWLQAPQEQAKRNPKPYAVFQSIPRPELPRFLFTVHARSLEQARASLVAAKVAGETIVPVSLDGASR
jgi:hypothetical protein